LDKKSIQPHQIIEECLQLALLGKGKTKTNPCVGAVVVKDGEIIGRGFHEEFGGPHAEVVAIDEATESVEGADLYVTLEPCSHQGKTPPCTQKILESGIKRVFVGIVDPNPVNAGKGIDFLMENGVEVYPGFLEKQGASLIEEFVKNITYKKPYYSVKLAQSIDGKVATHTGDSKWITSSSSRNYVHYLRSFHNAILVGVNTVIADDPQLTVRGISSDSDPYKIVLDPNGRMPLEAYLLTEKSDRLIYVTCVNGALTEKVRDKGAVVIECGTDGNIDLDKMSDELFAMNISSVMIEGGGETAGRFMDAGLVDKCYIFIAPIIIGGQNAKMSVGGEGVAKVADALKLKSTRTMNFEEDILLSGKINDYTEPVLELTEKVRNRCSRGL